MRPQTSPKLNNARWHLRGLYLDSCNCDWGCPCQFNAKPTHGNCEGLFGVHINGNIYRSGRNVRGIIDDEGMNEDTY
jgi:hypothetical protein